MISAPANTATPTQTVPVTPSATPTATATAGPILTFNPVADAYVDENAPGSNYGTSSILRTYTSPEQRSYLRFSISGLAGRTITRATLRLYANASSSDGYTVSAVPDTAWSETAITYNNLPMLGATINSIGSHGGARYISVDVTSYITGDGVYALALTTASTKVVSYPSREADTNRPELVIEFTGNTAGASSVQQAGGLVAGRSVAISLAGVGPIAAVLRCAVRPTCRRQVNRLRP
jgi:hypothetical protein